LYHFAKLSFILIALLLAAGCKSKSGLISQPSLGGDEAGLGDPSPSPGPSPSPSPFPSPLPSPTPTPEPTTGVLLYTQYCSQCHLDISVSDRQGRTAEQITNAINTVGFMSQLRILTPEQIQLIADALAVPQPPPSPPPLPSPTPGPVVSGTVSSVAVTVGTREYVSSQLTDIFLIEPLSTDETRIQTIINDLVKVQFVAFGGPCNRYDAQCPGFTPGLIGFAGHDSRINATATPIPNVLRKGYIIRACEEILAIDASVNNALSKVGLTTSSTRTDTNIRALADLFYPGRNLTTEGVSALMNVATVGAGAGLTAVDQWRFIMSSLCEASYFEMQ